MIETMAPGVDILSTLPDNAYGPLTGTSMAAPLVAGIAALAWSHNPELTRDELRCMIQQTSARLPEGTQVESNDEYGYGRIDAQELVDRAMVGSPGECEA